MTKTQWIQIEGLDPEALVEGELRSIQVNKKRLCLVRHDQQLHAFPNKCPHAGGPFSAGHLKDGKVVCPWHRFAFDLQSGQSDSGGYFIDVYPVKEKDGSVWVKLPEKKRFWWF